MRRPTEKRLRRVFAEVLTGLLAATAGTAALSSAGCGGAAIDRGGGPIPNFVSMCEGTGPAFSLLSGLHTSPPIDGAIARTETAFPRAFPRQQPGVSPDPTVVGDEWTSANGETVGAPCTKAANPQACLLRVQGYRVLPTTREACIGVYPGPLYADPPRDCAASYIIYTRGDAVGVARNLEETRALIGTVDSVEEALYLATRAGYQKSCNNKVSSAYRTTADGGWDLELSTLSADGCGDTATKDLVHVDYKGEVTKISSEAFEVSQCAVGRRPAGLCVAPGIGAGAVGQHFAAMATLETASVIAFRRLHRQLAAHGAPPALLARIRKAVRDEIRHARTTTALAKKYGVTPAAPSITACDEAPSLLSIALENAREGCVRETYGALVAHFQMTHARDEDVRRAMTTIADEETEHAALSWDIAAWVESQLGAEEQALLLAERRDAFKTLARELAQAVDPHVQHASGVPGPRDAVTMLQGLAPMVLS